VAGVRQTSHAWYCFENVERFELVLDPVALLSACDTSCFKRIRTSSPAILSLTELSRFSAFPPLQVDRRKCCQLSSIDRSTFQNSFRSARSRLQHDECHAELRHSATRGLSAFDSRDLSSRIISLIYVSVNLRSGR